MARIWFGTIISDLAQESELSNRGLSKSSRVAFGVCLSMSQTRRLTIRLCILLLASSSTTRVVVRWDKKDAIWYTSRTTTRNLSCPDVCVLCILQARVGVVLSMHTASTAYELLTNCGLSKSQKTCFWLQYFSDLARRGSQGITPNADLPK